MNLLLDTHTFIWFNEGSSDLSPLALATINDTNNQCYISVGTLWEMSIKVNLGKLSLNTPFDFILEDVIENGFLLLPISFPHLQTNVRLPFHHRDPFDRLLIAQAIVQDMDVIGADTLFDAYFAGTNLKRIW